MRFISSALFSPTRRGRRWVPPKPGMIPSLISGWPKIAERAAMRTSQAIASSQPPPKARPLTAAIVTIPSEPSSRKSACAPLISAAPEDSSMVVNALMSAPAQYRNGLEEAITSARTGGPAASLTWLHTLPRSSTTCGEIEFIWPLASHAIATPSARVSSLTTSAGCSASGCG